ncbi:hypothetical protein C1940_16620 (plasmid) [Lactiplantibacillus plantarum subsp. plantarum]|uniref:hypothetical protein n=1 Tax=Lactiplantibacillus plantarum TaxID=1590 RepID=UPI000CD3348B|nr:hypothetical protein [Lactiplantibacillus plantarum]AUV74089.1 hypothetical protein C1940_16620 [Lactiplantibacillus plantarum subsp. plantarum]
MNNTIFLKKVETLNISLEELKGKLDRFIASRDPRSTDINTESSYNWILRGALAYFATLESDFLGASNDSGIPEMQSDHFANTFYRLSNTLNSYCQKLNISRKNSKNWDILSDIRTLIVHSGGAVKQLTALDDSNFKDDQLERIIKLDSTPLSKILKLKSPNADYRITIQLDKHDRTRNSHKNDVDYDWNKENFVTKAIFFNSEDIKNTVLSEINKFLDLANNRTTVEEKPEKLPSKAKPIVVDNLDLDKLAEMLNNKDRGDYMIENGQNYWDGFGLKRLLDYAHHKYDEPQNNTVSIIEEVIKTQINKFWEAYQDETISDNCLPSLNVFKVFAKYLPDYKKKGYLEGAKILNIVPNFNSNTIKQETDVDYLIEFICVIHEQTEIKLDLENTPNGIICDYIYQCVKQHCLRNQ